MDLSSGNATGPSLPTPAMGPNVILPQSAGLPGGPGNIPTAPFVTVSPDLSQPQPMAMPMPQPVMPAMAPAMMPPAPLVVGAPTAVTEEQADDIDEGWVERAKGIVEQTQHDPYLESKELAKLKAEFLHSRYNKQINIAEDSPK